MLLQLPGEDAIKDALKTTMAQIFSEEFIPTIIPVAVFVGTLVIYSVLIWHFYRIISKRDIFHIDAAKFKYEGAFGKFFDIILYLFKYILVYPLLTFVFFMGYAMMLIFLSRNLDVNSILITSISLISAIRVAAYYNEDLAKDLAKMFPFAILAIFLLDPSFFSLEQIIQKIFELPVFIILGLRFIIFVIALEWTLRFFYSIYAFVKRAIKGEEPQKIEVQRTQ